MLNQEQKTDVRLFLTKGVVATVNTGFFAIAWYGFYREKLFFEPFYAKGDVVVVLLYAAMYVAFARLYGGFDLTASTVSELSYAQSVAAVITAFFTYIIICLLQRSFPNVLPLLAVTGGVILFSLIWTRPVIALTNRWLPPRGTVLIYGNLEAMEEGKTIISEMPKRFSLDREVHAESGFPSIRSLLVETKPEAVMICGVSSSTRNDIVKYCIEHKIEAYVRPNIGDFLINGAKSMQLCAMPVLLCQRCSPAVWYLAVKRGADILLSIAALIALSPIMLATAAAIKLCDGGPVLYRQVRLTKNRREFYVYKFRSMRVDAEKDGVARLASQEDDRITPVGKIIRKLRIDELPQLLCILKGTMTIVGPRPERPEIAEQYEKEMPEFSLRLQAKAGLTGLAQVYGKYNTTPYNKLQMDLQYIGSMGLVTDLKIIFATIKVLFTPESTEGVAQGQTTARKNQPPEDQA